MGQRANLVILQANGYELYYNHWCANTLPNELFWGENHARSFIEAQAKVANDDWLNEVWAEGGALMDLENRKLLFFGGEEERYNIPYRRLFIKLMDIVWEDWEIEWAEEGIISIVEYLGLPRQIVLSDAEDELGNSPVIGSSRDLVWSDIVSSITFGDGETVIFPLQGGIEEYLFHGPNILSQFKRSFGYPDLCIEERGEEFPVAGFHVNSLSKELHFWRADPAASPIHKLKDIWAGWQVFDYGDQYELHSKNTLGRLHFPKGDYSESVQNIQTVLLKSPVDPLIGLSSLINKLRQEDNDVQVSEYALMHASVVMDKDAKVAILHHAISALKL
ncbi:hypothetical protein [Paenibacillus sp. NPDC058071]|uniref:hypothetical protein n=1 Tax=Paenibacillus sp. NPDC058071 TaxID=3346326 RepID=UPI0036D98E43